MLGITGEEEGHNADNESLASYFSNIGYEADQIPTRDTGIYLAILSFYLIFLIFYMKLIRYLLEIQVDI